jgi:hypothetical protein
LNYIFGKKGGNKVCEIYLIMSARSQFRTVED